VGGIDLLVWRNTEGDLGCAGSGRTELAGVGAAGRAFDRGGIIQLTIVFAAYSENRLVAAGGIALVAALALMGAAILSPVARGAGPTFVASIARGLTVFLGLCVLAAILLPEGANTDASLGENAFELVLVLASLCVAVGVSWRTFKTIARSYESKRYSELQVTLHAYWSLVALAGFAMTMSMSLVEGGSNGTIPYGLAVFGCWVAYEVGLRAWLRRTMRHAGASLGPLLLLRVFKGAAASQAFINRFLAYWRFAAPVWMIGGADLAGSQMEPTE
jgi:hypothetical protein